MRLFLTIIFSIQAYLLAADIPRLDVIEISYQNQHYYLGATVAHLDFREGCVFDRYSEDYLYEQEDFFSSYFGTGYIMIYEDLLSIPKSKFSDYFDRLIRREDNGDQVHFLLNEKKKLKGASLDSITFVNRIVGNTAGITFSPTLSMADKDWLMDYPLESIFKIYDGELCSLEFYAIQGNVSEAEALQIKSKLKELYDAIRTAVRNDVAYTGIRPEEYQVELLQKHILMVGFCSC